MKLALIFFFTALEILARQAAPAAATTETQKVGPLPNGGFLLNSGWTIRPAGEQVPVDTLPMSTAVSANGKFLLVLNGGYNPPSISVIDIAQKHEIGRTRLPDAWLGLTIAPGGNLVYVGGGSSAMVYELSLDQQTGALTRTREFAAIPDLKSKGQAFIGDVALSPDGGVLFAADLYDDTISVINVKSGQLRDRWKTGKRPYRIIVTPGGRQLLITSWAEGVIYQHTAGNGVAVGKTRVGPHASDMLWVAKAPPSAEGASSFSARLFVAAANTNSVYSFGVTSDGQLTPLESINISMTPMHPLGMTPSALAANAAGSRLYVVCSDANAVAIVDTESARSRVLGFIPTGWYPTAARALADQQIVVVNGKGLGSHPNPHGPNPAARPAPVHAEGAPPTVEYVGHIQTGTVGILPAPDEPQIRDFTDTVLENSPYRDDEIYGPITDEQQAFFSRFEGHESPIKHVIYVIKENRTYDQVLGDLEKGNGDKSLNLFGEKITPNLHQLAREFVTYDNFYENADVSADGHNWASAAIAPDYATKMWPNEYAHRSKVYDFEGTQPANSPPAGYIWNNALQAGITIRDYGEWVTNLPPSEVNGPRQIKSVNDPALEGHTDMNFRSFDLSYSDLDRAKEFLREWKEFDASGQAPQMIILRLPNDHTEGTRPGALTPFSFAAQNDYAVGMVVDAISHSQLWSTTAMFIIEDDAQNGPDHVDSHRAPVWVISPFTHTGQIDSRMYNQTSVLRTMEMIVGLRPLTHFDAAARPMFASFSRTADPRQYTAIQPKVPLTDKNPANGPGAEASLKMDFSDADLADDDDLTEVLWKAIKHTNPPPPTRSIFGR